MSAPAVTRRAVLGAGAALGAMGIPIAAEAGIPASHPDADLPILLDCFAAALAAWEATDAPLAEAMERARAAYPPRPDALRHDPDDFRPTSIGWSLSRPPEGEEERVYGDRAAAWLRARPASTWFRSVALGPECEARRLEILAAWDGWQAEREAVEDRVGLIAASQAEEAAAEAYDAAHDALEGYQPRTVAGLVLKATWVAERLSTSEGARVGDLGEMFVRQVAAFGGVAS